MSLTVDISKGIEPMMVSADIRNDERIVDMDGKRYVFRGHLPFTTVMAVPQTLFYKPKRKYPCADKALVLKHADKAQKVIDLATLETVHG